MISVDPSSMLHIKKLLSLFLSLINDRPESPTSAFLPTPASCVCLHRFLTYPCIVCMPSPSTQGAAGKTTGGVLLATLNIFFPFCALTNFLKKKKINHSILFGVSFSHSDCSFRFPKVLPLIWQLLHPSVPPRILS